MREISKRTVAVVAAAAAFAMVGSGCHAAKKTVEGASSSMSSMASSATSAISSAASSALAGPTSTQIAGANGTMYTVNGPILAKWLTLTPAAQKALGAPKDNQQSNPDGGAYQQFDDGVLIYKVPANVYVVWGKIRDKWNELGGSQGKLGYPTSDETNWDNMDATKVSAFEHGTITWKHGEAEPTVTMNP